MDEEVAEIEAIDDPIVTEMNELLEKALREDEEYTRRQEEDRKAAGHESHYFPVFGPNPRPMTFAQLKRQTFRRKRTAQSIAVGGMYFMDLSDPKRPVKPITTQYPPNYNFGFTKHHYIMTPNVAAEPSLIPGPASGTRSQVKRRRSLLPNPDPAPPADADTSRDQAPKKKIE